MNPVRFFLVLAILSTVTAQVCDNTGISLIAQSDITSDNGSFGNEITLSGDALLDSTGISLTNTQNDNAGTYGGLFFNNPANFAGSGGFSAKFALRQTAGSGGEGWEFIIANSNNRDFAPPPFGTGNPSNGLAGWSRTNAMVIEFDTSDASGEDEQDSSGTGNHVGMFLNGAEICQESVSSNFADGSTHFIWLDFIGFATTMQVRISTLDSRPATPTLECGIDVWGSMSISQDNHVGFGAYNSAASTDAVHYLVEQIDYTDAYRPIDTDDTCAYYTDCELRSSNSLCTADNGDGTCSYRTCPPVFAWTVGGGSCCSFVERNSLRSTGDNVNIIDGGRTSCAQQRVTVVKEVDDSGLCDGTTNPAIVEEFTEAPATTEPVTVVPTTIATAAGNDDGDDFGEGATTAGPVVVGSDDGDDFSEGATSAPTVAAIAAATTAAVVEADEGF